MIKVTKNNQFVWNILENYCDKIVLSDVHRFTITDRLNTFDRKVWRNTSPLIKGVLENTMQQIWIDEKNNHG